MLFNKMKNYKIYSSVAKVQQILLACLTMFVFISTSFNLSAEQAVDSKLLGLSYNTIQDDQIELVFELSAEILTLPVVKTSMDSAYVEIKFTANMYDEKIKETLINHAGITNVVLDNSSGKVVALINLDKLSVFDVALNGKQFSITFNYFHLNENQVNLHD